MGLFSFYTADTNRVIQVSGRGRSFPVYLLIPKEFGGGSIEERAYNGYGGFGYEDVYVFLADCNREHLKVEMLQVPAKEDYSEEFYYNRAVKNYKAYCDMLHNFVSGNVLQNSKYGKDWKRELMIKICCYDDMPGKLAYPLKIVENRELTYEEVDSFSRECDNCLL